MRSLALTSIPIFGCGLHPSAIARIDLDIPLETDRTISVVEHKKDKYQTDFLPVVDRLNSL
jgi:hypothetical protein